MATALKDCIFFEKQEGRLCAQHALNMLLQGPYFSADVLADIANELDDREKQVLNEEARARFQSQNLDDTGFFSIQVITVALKRSWDLNLIPIQSPDLAEYSLNPEKANAYICNLQEHWFVLKKFHKQWFILNSVLEGPKEITESYLELYLKQLENEGYAIFLVDGLLPTSVADEVAQEVHTMSESMKGLETPQPSAPPQNQVNEDEELEMAIALSLSEAANRAAAEQATSSSGLVKDEQKPGSSQQPISYGTDQQPKAPEKPDKTEAELLRERREAFLKQFDQ